MDKEFDELLESRDQAAIDAYAYELRRMYRLTMKAHIDYNATDDGMEELYDQKEELLTVGASTQEIDRAIEVAQARAVWQADTYRTLKEIEANSGFGEIYALEDALKYASIELEIQKDRAATAKHLHQGAKQQLAEMAITDLGSYIKTTEKKMRNIRSTNQYLRDLGKKGMEGKKFISMPSENS